MTANYGPPDTDHTFAQAVDLTSKDLARLQHVHTATWSVDLSLTVIWRCECSPGVPRTQKAIDNHIIAEIRKARGPARGPQK
jgi:hypothetical protein